METRTTEQDWPALPNDRLPSGDRHAVGAGELFFSTTDEKGVITEANSVFVRLSGFARDQLMGAPHNIVRHPSMPQGAFKLMWDTLGAGEPFCAYVDNLAANGSTYSVFATITPIPGGYLSVRSRPMMSELQSAAGGLYRSARAVELEARDAGLSSRQAAASGLSTLASGLVVAGIPTYEELVWLALPAEVDARQGAGRPLEARTDATGPLQTMSSEAVALAAELRGWSAQQDDLATVADALESAMPELCFAMSDANAAAQSISRVAGGNPALAPILLSVTIWAAMMTEIDAAVSKLVGDLEALRVSSAKTRFRIALARLHADAAGQFVNELIDDVDPDFWGEDAIDVLCRALADGMGETTAQSRRNAELAALVSSRIEQVAGLMQVPRDLIANWQDMASGRSDEAVQQLLPTVSDQLDATGRQLDMLERLAEECSAVATPLDARVAERHLEAIEQAVGVFTAPAPAPRRGSFED